MTKHFEDMKKIYKELIERLTNNTKQNKNKNVS
jgi:hypothetical protein